jgi:hypothetical protein
LTQELSLLLAQSIAQGQVGKRAPAAAAAAGSEFANLAALVSASQNQRNLQPSFKDGLSSLAYARPVQPVPPPAPVLVPPSASLMSAPGAGLMAPASNGLLVSEPHDEEPMPIPSTWRQPAIGDDDRWYRQQLGAAGLGLVAGLIVVVPAVLWLSGWLGGPTKAATRPQPPMAEAANPVQLAPVKVVIATTNPRITVERQAPAEPPVVMAPPKRTVMVEPRASVPPPRPVEPVLSRADQVFAQAKRLVDSGDIRGAREVLQVSETAQSAAMTFLLAETYDPNMLASWQTRGITANPERARALYLKARELGDGRAQQRLDWLTAN